MRPRLALLMSALTVLTAVASPGVAEAAPRQNRGLTIAATPNRIIAGDPVLIYGQLQRPDSSRQTVVLYHRVNPSSRFTIIGTTATNTGGYYEFTRAADVVQTNRNWFVRAPSLPGDVRSRTVRERVAATVSLGAFTASGAATSTGDTGHPIVFAGHVDPAGVHVGERVLLQQQGASGEDWHTLARAAIGLGSGYSISHKFAIPGARGLRVAFEGDVHNTSAVSDTVTVAIEQVQDPTFTINTSAAVAGEKQSTAISGVLYMPAATTATPVPDPGVPVTLTARRSGGKPQAVDDGTTRSDGSYSFKVSPQQDTEYVVRTTFAPPAIRYTATLLEAVHDSVTISANTSSAAVARSITVSGMVTPDKAGKPVDLQLLGKDGDFHQIGVASVGSTSSYEFKLSFGVAGTYELRALVPGDRVNAAGHSPVISITVSLPPVGSLPAAS